MFYFHKNILWLWFLSNQWKTPYDSFVKNIIIMIFKKYIMVISLKIIMFSWYDFAYFFPVLDVVFKREVLEISRNEGGRRDDNKITRLAMVRKNWDLVW